MWEPEEAPGWSGSSPLATQVTGHRQSVDEKELDPDTRAKIPLLKSVLNF